MLGCVESDYIELEELDKNDNEYLHLTDKEIIDETLQLKENKILKKKEGDKHKILVFKYQMMKPMK